MTLAINGGKPIRSEMLPYGRQWLDDDAIEQVIEVLKSDYITQGPMIDKFEQAVARYVGTDYAVAFSNGTAALHAACFAAGIGPSDEVITSPITFVASSNCVLYSGGTPVFADIDPDTYNIDPECIVQKLSDDTKAIIPVDFTGQPAQMDKIMSLAKQKNLTVIHDAAHSLGAKYRGRKVGTYADMTMFSFHPVKLITSGEGGMIVTDNPNYYEKLKLFRSHGITRDADRLQSDAPWYYEMQELGYNYRLTDIQAALGLSQLKQIDAFIERRRKIASVYTKHFSEMPGIIPPYQDQYADSSWHIYVIQLDLEQFTVDRRQIFEALRQENIGVNVHYIPVYYQPYYRRIGYEKGICPNAERYYESAVTLPLFPKMTDRDVEDVIRAVDKVTRYYRK